LADKQNTNIFIYPYIATRLAGCISSEYRFIYPAYYFQLQKVDYLLKYAMLSTYKELGNIINYK